MWYVSITKTETNMYTASDILPYNHTDVGTIFDNRLISTGESFSFAFDKRHVWNIDYASLLHPQETNSIIVQEEK